jgi:hypothetical protein
MSAISPGGFNIYLVDVPAVDLQASLQDSAMVMLGQKTGTHGEKSTQNLAYTDRRARKHYRQIRYEQGTTADFKLLRCPVRGKKATCQKTEKLSRTSRPTARGTPKRSARFFLRSSSSGSTGSSGAPRFLAGCLLLSADASTPKRSALAFSFPPSCTLT